MPAYNESQSPKSSCVRGAGPTKHHEHAVRPINLANATTCLLAAKRTRIDAIIKKKKAILAHLTGGTKPIEHPSDTDITNT